MLGEERAARAIAKAIVARRAEQPITTTGELAEIVAAVLGRKRDETKHPATRTFQALRLYLNEELTSWHTALPPPSGCLKAGGRLVVVTFHSLEDRIAKRFFASRSAPPPRGSRHLPEAEGEILAPSFRLLNRRPLEPKQGEIAGIRGPARRGSGRPSAPRRPLILSTLPRSGCRGSSRACEGRLQFASMPKCCVSSISVSCWASSRWLMSSIR